MKCSFAADEAFGPVVASCRRTFDFTLFFEESVLSIVPSSIFILLATLRLAVLWRRPPQVRREILSNVKLLVSILYASLQFAVLVEYCTIGRFKTRASIPSAALTFVAAVFLCFTSLFEHTKSRAPSFLLSVYLLVTLLLDTVRVRTLWQIGEVTAISSIFVAGFAIKVALIVTESWSKRRYLIKGSQGVAGEELAGFLSKSLFLWANPLLMNGFRNWLKPSDLGPTDSKLSSIRLIDRFNGVAYTKWDLAPKYKLFVATVKSIGWNAAGPVIPRLFLTAFTFAQPFLVTSILNYLQNSDTRSKNDGYGLIGACVLVYVGIAITSAWYWQQTNRLTTMIRGVLVSCIFTKTLRLSPDSDSETKAMTLMIADVQSIVGSATHLNELWAGIIETALAIWLLQRQVGLASLSMVGLIVACAGFTLQVAKMAGPRQQAWFAAMQVRLKPTSKMLSSFKAVKMLGADERVRGLITSLRNLEIKTAKPFRATLTQRVTLSYVTLTISPVLVFAVFIGIARGDGAEFDVSRLFTSLILISLLANPLIYLFQVIPSIAAAIGCLERVQTYLDIKERVDPRQIETSTLDKPSSDESVDEKSGDVVVLGEKARSDGVSKAMLSIKEASFAWNATSKAVLNNVNISIHRGEHVAIVGQVGCGKSLLLNAILGEAVQSHGSLAISTSEIAYCSQSPWLENLAGKETLSRHEHEDEAWRRSVIWACAVEDVEKLTEYENGAIGTGGAILSGGQKQRLALARAVYSRKQILLLDDPFSALDKTTRSLILQRLFGARGLLRRLGTTVIYTTHDEQFRGSADRLFEVNSEGTISEKEMLPGARQAEIDEVGSFEGSDALPETKENATTATMTTTTAPTSKKEDSKKLLIQDRTVYKAYFKTVGTFHTIVFLMFGVVFAFTLKFPNLWVQWWSEASYGPGERSLSYWIGIYALLQILPLIAISGWVGHLMAKVIPNSARGLHARILDTALHAPFAFISKTDVGGLLNRFNQDLMMIDARLPLDMLNTASAFFTSFVSIILVTISVKYLLGVLPVLFVVLYILQNFYLRTSKQLRHIDLESKAALHTKFLETCSGLSTIRAFAWESKMIDEFLTLLDRSQEPVYLLPSVQRWLQLVLNLIVAALTVLVLGVAISIESKVNPAAIGVAFLNATTLGETLTHLIVSWTSLETSLGAIARISAFVRDTPQEQDPASPENAPHDWPKEGGIEFRNVRASYAPGTETEEPVWCLKNINLRISPGEKVAVCGRTGSGKSSLILLLLAMLTPASGSILIDGIDISHLPRSIVRKRLNAVPQDVFALAKSNREELDSRGLLTDKEIIAVLEKCGIWEKVQEVGGLDGVSETEKLSAGEAQLFCLARAVVKSEYGGAGGGVVVIDEATSSVDEATERKIHDLTVDMLREKTVISVLHRLETVVKYDKILVLDEGRVLDFGSAVEVVQRCELFSGFKDQETREPDMA